MQKIIFPFLLIVILISSCRSYRHIYSAAPANNPFFNNKGDAQIAAFYSGGGGNTGLGVRDKNEGLDLQGAYALGNEFAITSSYFHRNERDFYHPDYYDTSTVSYKRRLGDFGIGYFKALDSKKTIFFNLYGGLGFGKFSIKDHGLDEAATPYSRYHTARIFKWYIQPSFNFFDSKSFRIGFNSRFSFLRFYDISTNYNSDERIYFNLDWINKRTVAVFEPSMNFQFGIPGADWLKTEAQVGFAMNWNNSFPSTRRINASIGFVFDLGSHKKSADQK